MNSLLLIKNEYFMLAKKLNQANKLKNLETEVYFYIDSADVDNLKLFAAISNSQKILLSKKVNKTIWVDAGFSEFVCLEIFISDLLNKKLEIIDLTKHIKSHIFKLTD